MITLKDYVGNIYKEITKARVQSDIETVEVAKEYAKHDLLKHFSIPNMKMRTVEITIPVAIDNPEVKLPSVSDTVVLNSIMKATNDIVKETEGNKTINKLNTGKLKIVNKQNIKLLKDTNGKINLEKKKLDLFVNKSSINSFKLLKPQLGSLTHGQFKALLNAKTQKEVSKKGNVQLEKIPVIIETNKLRDVKSRESLMNIKIVIEEDTMEWMREIDDDGNSTSFLSYE